MATAQATNPTPSLSPKAFHFVEGKPPRRVSVPDANKENAVINPKSPARSARHPSPSQHSRCGGPGFSPSKSFPSTPATRLPLADLIGNADERGKRDPKTDESPEDQISWNARRSPQKSQKKTPAKRVRKRARSSSPPSTARSSAKRDPGMDLAQPFQTPQTDPAADLWRRYTIGWDVDTPSGLQTAAFNNLLVNSSPQLEDDRAGNVGGLRRWTSCGVEWPTSKSKRRKVEASRLQEIVDQPLVNQPLPKQRNQSTSRIGSLLDRIQESLAQPSHLHAVITTDDKGPSSSSPLPIRDKDFDRNSISPCRAPDIAAKVASGLCSPSRETCSLSGQLPKSEGTSFGSDTLDEDMLEAVEISLMEQSLTAEPKENTDERSFETLGGECDNIDEFGDDLDVDELEHVASLHDTKPAFRSVPTDAKPSHAASDEFDDDDIDEESFACAEASATQAAKQELSFDTPQERNRTIQRYRIVNVSSHPYTTNNGQVQEEKVLAVEDERTKLYKAVTLRGSWTDTRCTKGSYVHIIGDFDKSGLCTIDDEHGMLILHPDHLISALVVADSFGCLRKSVLQDRIKTSSEPNPPMLYGTLLHEIFQEAISANRWDDDWLRQVVEIAATRHLDDLYAIKLSVKDVVDHLTTKLPQLQAWAETFVREDPSQSALVQDKNDPKVTMSVNKLLDVEEHIWSPMYGLKGNVDATIQVRMRDSSGERTLTVPFELKTGRNTNISHRAQTALYTLLLSDRYDIAVAYGILFYIETSDLSRIPAIRHELRHMIMQRNELACYVRERLSLPPMLKNSHVCSKCYAKTSCFLYHRLIEDGDGETSGMRDKFDAVCRHLQPSHQAFFKKWDDLLTKEESELMKFKRELWTMTSIERERAGRCFSNVVLESANHTEASGSSKINRFQYTFRKAEASMGFTFSESQLTIGEPIVISDEDGHYALANGYVTSVQDQRLQVAVDRRLHNARKRSNDFDPLFNQSFFGIMEVGPKSIQNSTDGTKASGIRYRIDKDEFSNGMALVRNHLLQIMDNDIFHARELRDLIIDGTAPRFKTPGSAFSLSGPPSQMAINDDQRLAIEKIMAAQDYALVLGMPGTGKTTTIAHIIRALVGKGKSVLLTSYTHTAVDNILLKIRQDDIGVLRLGAIAKVHPEVRDFAILGGEPKGSIEDLRRAYHEPQVVATTCLGISHQIFSERIFDYCIVDEASQITLPVCLGPIRMAKAFVLVGDHYQLPPLVQNQAALEGGLDVSLFRLLCEQQPPAVTALKHQYRMNEQIMSISNKLIYDGQLRCGSESVAKRRLVLSNYGNLSELHAESCTSEKARCRAIKSGNCWLDTVLNPEDSSSVVFLDTDSLGPDAAETIAGSRISNTTEALLVAQLSRALILGGLDPTSLGIVTLYRSQLALIKSHLASPDIGMPFGIPEQIEAHTADRFQGRDKECVILSCVRSNSTATVGDLLKDWRRVNVAVTRARSKLLIIGSANTLRTGDELLSRLVDMCTDNGWLVRLPNEAAIFDMHRWSSGVSGQVSGSMHSSAHVKTEAVQNQPQAEDSKPVATTSRTPSGGVRPALGVRSANVQTIPKQKPFKPPTKVGRVTSKAVLGTQNMRAKRPVLADIVSEIVGDDFLD